MVKCGTVKLATFEDLLCLPDVEHFESAFRKATGVSITLVPADEPQPRTSLGRSEDCFCSLAASTPEGCALCSKTENGVVRECARELKTQQICCYAGLTVAAMPVVVGGRHVATLLSGRVFRREPTKRDFATVVEKIGVGVNGNWEKKARDAYFKTPVVTSGEFDAILKLLRIFARHLANSASCHRIAACHNEPSAVACAKQFVQVHVGESVSLSQIVEHVHLSRFYFCKLFKKTTGMTFTEYVSLVRVEKAKELLLETSLRISEIAYDAGFGSIPRFNNVFKQNVGMPPGQYRTTLRSQFLA